MREIFLCKYGEIALKGANRSSFEALLVREMKFRLGHIGKFTVTRSQSVIRVEPAEEMAPEALDAAYSALRKVFGIVAVSRVAETEKDFDAIAALAVEYLGERLAAARTFKVETKRADKKFPMTSIEISQYVGGMLHDAYPHLSVDVHDPDLTIHVEIREKAAYVHAPAESGAGGLPIGMGGKAVSLLSGGIDSPVSSFMIAKRGVQLELVHFFSPPYTSQQAREKVEQLARELAPWCGRMVLHIVPFTEIQEEIRTKCPEDHFTLIMRRFMMRLAEGVARRTGCKALVTGECLGQVASQTMDALNVSDDACHLPVLRPVIGMDKEEIVKISRRIGTFATSILPYEDCCTVFTPRHPKTHPHLSEVIEYESVLDIDALVNRALDGVERIAIELGE